ncbi:D-alanine--D-alanine ligase [Varibaculum cambriense]|uniref:D-alanine--D-alanine ligase family protein n=1 Tax=Varibaculum cambriense TaxID=184870 RepID=UPI002906C527|nr:D-alanine--D-alanine ligase [Varibaculum cambriense]MDU3274514.1 D-alanine--D-alanine ligase [Varibaculum cambriense]
MTKDRSMKIAIITGGQLHEREVSLRSANRVATQLRRFGYELHRLELDRDLLNSLRDFKPDVVWPIIHGREGEDGSLQDLLELCGVAYVGSGPKGCRISLSKPVAKSVVEKNGLPTPQSVALPQILFRQVGADTLLKEVSRRLGYPLMVKPSRGGSAMGITYVEDETGLRTAMVNAFAYDDEVLIERFIKGREISVSIVKEQGTARALPPVEIRTDVGRYDFDARYLTGRTEFFAPAPLTADLDKSVRALALECHRVLELEDFSRIDLIVDEAGNPWFIDANVVPGMTDTSLWPLAAEADKGFGKLIQIITLQAAKRGPRS